MTDPYEDDGPHPSKWATTGNGKSQPDTQHLLDATDGTDIYAVVTLTNGRVTDDSTITVESRTAPVLQGAANFSRRRIALSLEDMGYRTVEILSKSDDKSTVRVLVERAP